MSVYLSTILIITNNWLVIVTAVDLTFTGILVYIYPSILIIVQKLCEAPQIKLHISLRISCIVQDGWQDDVLGQTEHEMHMADVKRHSGIRPVLETRAGGATTAAPAMAGAISGRPKAMHCWQVAYVSAWTFRYKYL